MHDGLQYDPIQGQGHEPLKVWNSVIFKGYLLPPFIMGAGKWPVILKLGHKSLSGPDFLIFVLVFELVTVSPLRRVDRQSR